MEQSANSEDTVPILGHATFKMLKSKQFRQGMNCVKSVKADSLKVYSDSWTPGSGQSASLPYDMTEIIPFCVKRSSSRVLSPSMPTLARNLRMRKAPHEKQTNVTLVGKNGVKVQANVHMLDTLSDVFLECLFASPSCSEVYIGNYGETVIHAMISYCRSASLKHSRLAFDKNESIARDLVELAGLAMRYQLDKLYCEADTLICEMLGEFPVYATAAFDSIGNETKDLKACLVQFIKEKSPSLLMETNALIYLSERGLLELMKAMNCDRMESMTYIVKWIEVHGGKSTSFSSSIPLNSTKGRASKRLDRLTDTATIQGVPLLKPKLAKSLHDSRTPPINGLTDNMHNAGTFHPKIKEKVIEEEEDTGNSELRIDGCCYQLTLSGGVAVYHLDSQSVLNVG